MWDDKGCSEQCPSTVWDKDWLSSSSAEQNECRCQLWGVFREEFVNYWVQAVALLQVQSWRHSSLCPALPQALNVLGFGKKTAKSTQQHMTFPLLTLLHSVFWWQSILMYNWGPFCFTAAVLVLISTDNQQITSLIYSWQNAVYWVCPAKVCLSSSSAKKWLFIYFSGYLDLTDIKGSSGHKTIMGACGRTVHSCCHEVQRGLNGADRRWVQISFR